MASLFAVPALAMPPNALEVTEGIVTFGNGQFEVAHKQMRAVLIRQTAPNATIVFTYLGPTSEVSHLDNGEVRHQLGLKLKAQNACNLVYVLS
jgi:hypothetical protein